MPAAQAEIARDYGVLYYGNIFPIHYTAPPMTALSTAYTKYGFVISADGRSRTVESVAPITEEMRARHNREDQQKIFCITDPDKTIAYAYMGITGSDDESFHVLREARKQSERFSARKCDTAYDYVYKFSYGIKRAFIAAWRDGHLDPWQEKPELGPDGNLVGRFLFVGYFHAKAMWIAAEFRYVNGRVKLEVIPTPNFRPGGYLTAGGSIMHKLLYIDKDQRFAQYLRSLGPDCTIEEAAEFGRGFIEACSTTLAAQLDPLCDGIGGHIHIASVTPADGFRWLVPPLQFET